MWTYWTSFLSCCLKHMQTRYGSPRVDSRCHQEHGWDSPCNCRIPSPQFILPSELICAFRGPEHAEVVPTFPSLSSWPFPKNILRPGLCSRDCLGYQLSQTIWCFISSHIGWRLLSQISWLHDFSMCGRRDWAVMLSTTSGMLCLLGFILQFFWGKKNLIISFLFHWVQWWVLVGGGDAGKKKKKKDSSSRSLSVFEIQWWRRMWEERRTLEGGHIPRPTGPSSGLVICYTQMIYMNTSSIPGVRDDHYWLWPSLLEKTKRTEMTPLVWGKRN